MKHFTNDDFANLMQVKMGFAKNLWLKRGVVPTIFDWRTHVEEPEQKNKIDVDELISEYSSEGILNESVNVSRGDLSVSQNAGQDESVNASCEESGVLHTSVDASTSPSHSMMFYGTDLREIVELKKKIETLQCENSQLRKQTEQQQNQLNLVRHEAEKKQRKSAWELATLKKQIEAMAEEVRNMEEKLATIFTNGQIKKLKSGCKRRKWSEDDISQSITLYAASPKAYRLLYKQSFPLPAVRTLQSWAAKVNISRGLIKPVFQLLKSATHMTAIQKVCILSFDEMKVKQSYCYDALSDSTLEPVNYVQVPMLRGLMAKWKQPVFYDFDCRMTKELLREIIGKCEGCGFTVVAVVCDLGATNRSLLNFLGVTEENQWFIQNDKKVYVFADVPHLLKLLRNHFLDDGFVINGKPIRKEIILDLLSSTSADLTITNKISVSHVNVAGPHRQKVKTAAKLFSHTVAHAITRAASLDHLQQHNFTECFHLFKTTNDWFDVMNVRVPEPDSRKRRHAYGLAIEVQEKILNEMTALMQTMRAIGKISLLPFQKGIIQSNNALKLMYEDLKARFNIKYILTYRLNQDVLENFFGVIRSKGGFNDQPDQQLFKYRMRLYLLGKNKGMISDAGNVEEDDTPDIELTQPLLTGMFLKNLTPASEMWPVEETEFDDLEYDGLEHLAGYICHKLRDNIPGASLRSNDDPTYTWTNHLNEGGFTIPSLIMMDHMRQLESVFKAMNEDGLLITNNFAKKHIEQASNIQCDSKVKKLFFRARMFFKIRKLNKELIEEAHKRKRKYKKILT